MEKCPLCGGRVDSLSSSEESEAPFVGRRQPDLSVTPVCPPEEAAADDSLADGQPVARFTGAAEAGYFAAELEHVAGIPAAVHISESFDAVAGCWQPAFVLRVPSHQAGAAARLVQEWSSQPDPAEETARERTRAAVRPGRVPPGSGRRPDRGMAEFDQACDIRPGETFTLEEDMSWGVPWLPLLLTLTAGSLTVWTVRKLHRPPVQNAPARPAEEILQEQVQQRAVLSGVWISQDPHLELKRNAAAPPADRVPGRNPPVISIQTDRRGTVIQRDHDGDGRFDEEFVFPLQEE